MPSNNSVPLDERFQLVANFPGSHIIHVAASREGTVFAWVAEAMTGQSAVIELGSSGAQVKHPLASPDGQHPEATFHNGFAVTDEAVWIGSKTTLFRLDRTTGAVSTRPLPEVPGSKPNR